MRDKTENYKATWSGTVDKYGFCPQDIVPQDPPSKFETSISI